MTDVQSEDNKRVYLSYITEKSKAVRDEAFGRFAALFPQKFAGLSDTELDAFYQTVKGVEHNHQVQYRKTSE